MLALVNTPGGDTPVEMRDVEEPNPAPNEAVVEVRPSLSIAASCL